MTKKPLTLDKLLYGSMGSDMDHLAVCRCAVCGSERNRADDEKRRNIMENRR